MTTLAKRSNGEPTAAVGSSGLVARLRQGCIWHQNAKMEYPDINETATDNLMVEAANRIESIESKLHESNYQRTQLEREINQLRKQSATK